MDLIDWTPSGSPIPVLYSSDQRDRIDRATTIVTLHTNTLGLINVEDPQSQGIPVTLTDMYNARYGVESPPAYTQRQIEATTAETGWTRNRAGELRYVAHGRIEEIDEDEDYYTAWGDSPDQPVSMPAPEGSSLAPLPECTTPPPAPAVQVMLLPSSPSDFVSRPAILPGNAESTPTSPAPVYSPCSRHPPPPEKPKRRAMKHPPPTSGESQDVSLVNTILDLVNETSFDVGVMGGIFSYLCQSRSTSYQYLTDSCNRIQTTLESISNALARRFEVDDDQWVLRTPTWHKKYDHRLYSLRITLERLRALGELPFRADKIHILFDKMRQHEVKLTDLGFKFHASFDRLKVRHLHSMLSDAHAAAHERRTVELASRDSFTLRWREGRAARADLRREYRTHVAGRRTSITS